MELDSGTRLGPYEIVAPLGAGGMGEVYRARDSRLGRFIAIKLLTGTVGSDARAQLYREARAAAALNHPHI
jgi:serine/threonine protein kinase